MAESLVLGQIKTLDQDEVVSCGGKSDMIEVHI